MVVRNRISRTRDGELKGFSPIHYSISYTNIYSNTKHIIYSNTKRVIYTNTKRAVHYNIYSVD